jgi:hypothetical protein
MTWSAPYVAGDDKTWIGFFGNYLGLLGAIAIAFFTFNKQKEKDELQDRKNNRSYIVLHDFNAPVKLKNVITNENSRIIITIGYRDLLNLIPKDKYEITNTAFLKLSHFGNPELIFDCHILINIHHEREKEKKYEIDINIGVIEKGIEIFIPLVPPEIQENEPIILDKVTIEYSTIKNERLVLVRDYNENEKEVLKVKGEDGVDEVLYEYDLIGSRWIYPNKIKRVEND